MPSANCTDCHSRMITLEDFQKFKNTADAFKSISKLMKGKVPKSLSKFLNKTIVERELEATLAVADKKLGKALSDEMGIVTKQTPETDELMRVIRFQLSNLLACTLHCLTQSITKRISR